MIPGVGPDDGPERMTGEEIGEELVNMARLLARAHELVTEQGISPENAGDFYLYLNTARVALVERLTEMETDPVFAATIQIGEILRAEPGSEN